MKSKEKSNKKIKLTLKNIIYFIAGLIILFYIYTFYNLYFKQNIVYAKNEEEVNAEPEEIKISQAEEIDINEIIDKNSKPGYKEEIVEHEEELEYLTTYRTNNEIPKGISYVVEEGRKGKQKITTKKIYQDENLIGEEQISTTITKAALNKVIEIGGGKTTVNKTVKVGDTIYVTSDMLAVMTEPSETSKKIATLNIN